MDLDAINAILDRTARLTEKNTQEIAELRQSQEKTERLIEETHRKISQQNAELRKTLAESQARTERVIEETNRKLGQQIGALGNKFGSFTEGMALDSVVKMLATHFGVNQVARRLRRRDKETGEEIELDYFGYENGAVNRVVLVEIKSQFRRRDIEQIRKKIERFHRYFPQYNESELFIVVAYVDFEGDELLREALAEGFFLATMNDEIFRLKTPKAFRGRDFNAAPLVG